MQRFDMNINKNSEGLESYSFVKWNCVVCEQYWGFIICTVYEYL